MPPLQEQAYHRHQDSHEHRPFQFLLCSPLTPHRGQTPQILDAISSQFVK
uniref:Uncharacterized protein MANES_14G063300 n=1 Tax=Rhizophora mucronata TaxID=61149 RepID=A0A2P2JIU5_RHIMU